MFLADNQGFDGPDRDSGLTRVLSWLYVKLEYHQEHHMFPMVPWYNLPALHELITGLELFRTEILSKYRKPNDLN